LALQVYRPASRARLVLALLAACVSSWASAADAQTQASPDDAGKAAYQQGLKLFDAGDYAAAADAFMSAYSASPDARHLWNLALAEYRAHRVLRALADLRKYASDDERTPTNARRARELIAELETKVARIEVTTDEGADVSIDGRSVGLAPLREPVDVDPDAPHTVVVHREQRAARRELPAPGAGTLKVTLALPAPPISEPVPSPPRALANNDVSSDAPTYRPSKLRFGISGGLAVGALALTGSAVYFALKAVSESNQIATYHAQIPMGACPSYTHCADLSNTILAERSDVVTSYWLYGAAGVLGVAAIATWFFLPSKVLVENDRRRGRIVPTFNPVARTVGLLGTF
jgi:hypothetical protein